MKYLIIPASSTSDFANCDFVLVEIDQDYIDNLNAAKKLLIENPLIEYVGLDSRMSGIFYGGIENLPDRLLIDGDLQGGIFDLSADELEQIKDRCKLAQLNESNGVELHNSDKWAYLLFKSNGYSECSSFVNLSFMFEKWGECNHSTL